MAGNAAAQKSGKWDQTAKDKQQEILSAFRSRWSSRVHDPPSLEQGRSSGSTGAQGATAPAERRAMAPAVQAPQRFVAKPPVRELPPMLEEEQQEQPEQPGGPPDAAMESWSTGSAAWGPPASQHPFCPPMGWWLGGIPAATLASAAMADAPHQRRKRRRSSSSGGRRRRASRSAPSKRKHGRKARKNTRSSGRHSKSKSSAASSESSSLSRRILAVEENRRSRSGSPHFRPVAA
eukprot:gnl/TRDRNA2_/TRDRNA2_130600_c0_seq2.p1 gnl/TRDRNA2_/TRDRNA2_130600_c0~~gnl/TRDRNA2_/TRDRNA2_130600_c0_seq2.p1  ORF type:complete len:235 (-),score=37.68 gnl/TRDRNA2_/TRDRNA2_130600_c0_seq2:42-746(-)